MVNLATVTNQFIGNATSRSRLCVLCIEEQNIVKNIDTVMQYIQIYKTNKEQIKLKNKFQFTSHFFVCFGFLKHRFFFLSVFCVQQITIQLLASISHLSVAMFKLFRSRLNTSLKRRFKRRRLHFSTLHTTETLGFAFHPSLEHNRAGKACAD